MALLHQAELRPTKLELLAEWAPTQPWFVGDQDAEFANIAAFRFDDPDGEVGVETILVRAGNGPTMQVAWTYRGAPLDGADAFLVGTMDHSVLGKRWVYDAVGDPVYLRVLANAALNGGHQAELVVQTPEGAVGREPNALVSGTGTGSAMVELPEVHDIVVTQEGAETVVTVGALHLRVQRVMADAARTGEFGSGGNDASGSLMGTWTGSPNERQLAVVTLG